MSRTALVLDWPAFDPATSVMLVEPGLLLMARSMPKYPDMTAALLRAVMDVATVYV